MKVILCHFYLLYPSNQVNRGVLALGVLPVCYRGAGPGAFSERGCLLFQVGHAAGDLPGRDCCGIFGSTILFIFNAYLNANS